MENIGIVCDRMIRDTSTSIVHHTKLLSHKADGTRQFNQDYDFDDVYAQEYAKVQYLIQKWRDSVASDQKMLYFFKHHYSTMPTWASLPQPPLPKDLQGQAK